MLIMLLCFVCESVLHKHKIICLQFAVSAENTKAESSPTLKTQKMAVEFEEKTGRGCTKIYLFVQ